MVKSIFLLIKKDLISSKLFILISTLLAILLVPPLPGIQNIFFIFLTHKFFGKLHVLDLRYQLLQFSCILIYIMTDKIARLKYLDNSFEVIESGTHVICAVSGKKISLENLNYWNVDLQEPYFSYIEANQKREKKV